jgi:hypothetical protein
MRYAMPNFPCEFEIPDDWLAEADAVMLVSRRVSPLECSAGTSDGLLDKKGCGRVGPYIARAVTDPGPGATAMVPIGDLGQ